jgi:hypothetical protein
MLNSAYDWIISLLAVFIMCGAMLYALGCHLTGKWGRRHRLHPAEVNPVYQRRAEFEARVERQQHVARHAERIVAAEYERVAHLYDRPTQCPVDVAVREATRVNTLFRP